MILLRLEPKRIFMSQKVVSLDDYRDRQSAKTKDGEKEALVKELGELLDHIDRNIMPLDRTGPIG